MTRWPPWPMVRTCFHSRRDDGMLVRLQGQVRLVYSRHPQPGAAIVESLPVEKTPVLTPA
jgi:hypothetical protein